MRSVYCRISLRENDLFLVRPVNIFRSENKLPTGRDATRRCRYVIVAVEFMEFWALDRRMLVVPVKNHDAIIQNARSVATHLVDDKHALDARAASCKRVNQIRIAVVVPQRARIDPTFRFLDK